VRLRLAGGGHADGGDAEVGPGLSYHPHRNLAEVQKRAVGGSLPLVTESGSASDP
jgi:hypothetical protein